MRPDLDWIADEAALGADLSRILRQIRENRQAGGKQFYVSLVPGVANAFDHEPTTPPSAFPTPGSRSWLFIATGISSSIGLRTAI